MSDLEYRYATFEMRSSGEGAVITGIAMEYGKLANIRGAFKEEVRAGAFGKISDIVLNYFHVRERPLARNNKDGGLTLEDSSKSLSLRAELPEYEKAVIDQIRRGLLRGLSVEMQVLKDYWPNFKHRVITKAILRGIGLVDTPAYSASHVAVATRSRQDLKIYPLVY